MLLDRATCDANHQRFIKRIIENETVWYLAHSAGVANSVSNNDDESTVLMFWSDRAYASRVQSREFQDYEEVSMDLFEFLFRWLPGMSGDGVLAGTNWSGDLIGVETDAFVLREAIEAQMPKEILRKHEARYHAETQ